MTVACERWPVACQRWSVACQLWPVACQRWSVACQLWPVACQLWSVSCQHWSVTCTLASSVSTLVSSVSALVNSVLMLVIGGCALYPPPASPCVLAATLACWQPPLRAGSHHPLPLSASCKGLYEPGGGVEGGSTTNGSRLHYPSCLTATEAKEKTWLYFPLK